jgi:two-component system, OmpR family, response regulator
MGAVRVLIVDDDRALRDALRRALVLGGYETVQAGGGEEAIVLTTGSAPDAVVLDIGLPDIDGLEVCRRLRGAGNRVPVLMLTARDAVEDRIDGLDAGADDYLVKPFDLRELEARARALVRRGKFGASPQLQHGRLRFDTVGRRALVDDQPLELSARELSMLETLLLSAGRVVSKEQLADQLTGWGEAVGANAIEVYIHRLRRKVEAAGVSVRTVRGLGYLLEKPGGT